MIFPINNGSRIVQSYSGSGTCETIFVTEDGNRWKHDPNSPVNYCTSSTLPQRIGRIENGYIK